MREPDPTVRAPQFVKERRSFEGDAHPDLLTFGAAIVAAVAAAEHGDRVVMALMLLASFWTAVRMVREKA